MKLLIIDDDEIFTELLRIACAEAGLDVLIAGTARDGIEQAKLFLPDLILLDQILPDLTGNEALKTLKGDPQTNALTVICMSNYHNNHAKAEAIQAGAIDYLAKDQLNTQNLVEHIQRLYQEVVI